MKNKTYFVIINKTIYAMEGTSIKQLACELLGVERPIKSMGSSNGFSNMRWSKNRGDIYQIVQIFTTLEEITQNISSYWRQDERRSRFGLSQLPDYLISDTPVCYGTQLTWEESCEERAYYEAITEAARRA